MAGHGGQRAGSGRKPRAVKYVRPVNAAEKQIVDRLPGLIDNLLYLAKGGYEIGSETFEPAGLVYAKGEGSFQPTQEVHPNLFKGEPVGDLIYPNLPADQLVVTKRVVSIAAPDRAANTYLVDRILGRTMERHEVDAELTIGGQVVLELDEPTRARVRAALVGSEAPIPPPAD